MVCWIDTQMTWWINYLCLHPIPSHLQLSPLRLTAVDQWWWWTRSWTTALQSSGSQKLASVSWSPAILDLRPACAWPVASSLPRYSPAALPPEEGVAAVWSVFHVQLWISELSLKFQALLFVSRVSWSHLTGSLHVFVFFLYIYIYTYDCRDDA